MKNLLDGKIAIVTGGGQGIGKAICLRLARDGAKMVILDVNERTALEVGKAIENIGGEVLVIKADVRDRSTIKKSIADVVSAWGSIDIVVNNAGVGIFNPLFDITEEELDVHFAVNVKGLFFTLQAASEYMVKQGSGKIINIASQAGRRGDAFCLSYCMSKAAVISITQSAALALAPYNINVNAIAPGVVDTDFWTQVDKKFAKLLNLPVGEPKRRAVRSIPLGRIEQPEDVANVVSFLAGPDSDYITGQTLNVDGGNILS
ncbi:glucose 1-dehydrogenase [Brevibacillus humidisoli]|uniref:glucose 1-dehydrogenase n=1 Tax=Brevibacillus humidisoli TaxID=2895522 RepID=UPI001E364A54|nr:glucose 1-dehydrogenase [Brevibacillus humidisoli]UFJ42996.1 glucose 1-dehydrogenase [Brevibacillus humidisoli]